MPTEDAMTVLTPFLTFTVVVALVVLLTIYAGIKTVPQGQQWTVERFGRYTRTLESGLRIIVPFIDRIGRKLSVMEQVLDVPAQTVITKDNAAVVAWCEEVVTGQVVDDAQLSEDEDALPGQPPLPRLLEGVFEGEDRVAHAALLRDLHHLDEACRRYSPDYVSPFN
jgi:hypothetical protein